MPLHDKIQTSWKRLLKSDGNLGCLYDAQRGVVRFISRGGTVDYDLVAMSQDEERKQEQAIQALK